MLISYGHSQPGKPCVVFRVGCSSLATVTVPIFNLPTGWPSSHFINPHAPLKDTDLISRVKQRDHAAFKELYQEYIGYVFSIVKRYVSDEREHPDVIQEIFARVFLKIDTYDAARGAFKFWLRRLTINQCLQAYRKQPPSQQFVPLDQVSEKEVGVAEALTELTKEEVEALLRQMPRGYREIFMLVVIDDHAHKEVAELLGISLETSRSQLSRAKQWLRTHLSTSNTIPTRGT